MSSTRMQGEGPDYPGTAVQPGDTAVELEYASPATYPPVARRAPLSDMLVYATGDGATSLVMNTFFSYAMLYYTKALGMNTAWAGLAMGVIVLWDAITDPFMGHITDNTRSRFGRRHPYMLVGGVLTVLCFYAVWSVPEYFRNPTLLFVYMVGINLLLRTTVTVYLVAQGALGFEICTDYNDRSKLQGIRNGLNMAVNLGSSFVIWTYFLKSRDGVDGTAVASNYQRLGLTFANVALVFICIAVFGTRKYIVDTRNSPDISSNNLRSILSSLLHTLGDPVPGAVYIFMAILYIGIVFVCAFQMFIYVDFMMLEGWRTFIVHGSTMAGAAVGSLLAAPVVRRLDKKPAIYLGVLGGALANTMLVVLFYTGWVKPGTAWGAIPIAMLLFLIFNSGFHLMTNVVKVTADSIMADVSEINRYRVGKLKDGGYSSMLTFVLKAGISLGMLLVGFCMHLVGYVPDQPNPPEVIRNLLALGFLGGAMIGLAALIPIAGYRVDRRYISRIKAALAAGRQAPEGEATAYELAINNLSAAARPQIVFALITAVLSLLTLAVSLERLSGTQSTVLAVVGLFSVVFAVVLFTGSRHWRAGRGVMGWTALVGILALVDGVGRVSLIAIGAVNSWWSAPFIVVGFVYSAMLLLATIQVLVAMPTGLSPTGFPVQSVEGLQAYSKTKG